MSHESDGRYWVDRAEECRAKAEGMRTPEARDALLHMAASYVGMAERAEARNRGDTTPQQRRLTAAIGRSTGL